MEGTIGEIRSFGGNFAPMAWALCQGQLMSIAQNTALFSILGTTYGGDGQSTFALPNLCGRVPVGEGSGPGLPTMTLGESAGSPNVTLTTNQMPQHNHSASAPTATAPAASASTTATPSASLAQGPATLGAAVSKSFGTPNSNLAPPTIGAPTIGLAGGSQPHNNMQPYLGMNFIICLEGIYPSRN